MKTMTISPGGSRAGGLGLARNSNVSGIAPSQPASPGRRPTGQNELGATHASGKLMSKESKSMLPMRDANGRTLIAPKIKTLATEFESFDMLWFDIETRARAVVEELTRPMLDKLVSQQDQILNL